MLSVINNNDLKFKINLNNVDAPSDDSFYYNRLLVNAGASVINQPFDSELFEFKPNSNKLNYLIYFLDFKDMNFNQDVVNNIEPVFSTYLDNSITTLTGGNDLSPYDFKQNNSHPLPETHMNYFKDIKSIVQEKPYVVTDFIGEASKLKPIKQGVPLFYNTFTFPYSSKIDSWINTYNKFSDKSFLFNSFLLIDIYTSTDPLTQQKIMSIPVFVTDRYMLQEQSVNGIKQLRPVFTLTEGVEGYSIFFLQTFGTDTLYVKYSFWDALNGIKIPLIPSSINTSYKKGIQSVSDYNKNNDYLMFKLNFINKKYDIYEFNIITNSFDIQAYDFDLYQLFHDDYWAGKTIPNIRPIALQEPSTFIVNFNTKIDLMINKTSIIKETNISKNFIDNTVINNFFDIRYNTDKGKYIKNFLKRYTNNLISVKDKLNFKDVLIYTDNNNVDVKTNAHQEFIDTITITNNNNDTVSLYNIFLSDVVVTHNPIYSSNPVGNMVVSNTKQINNIYNSYKTPSLSPIQKIIVENYSSYGDLGLINTEHTVLKEFYQTYGDAFTLKNSNAAKYNIIEGIDFNMSDPNSLGSYIRDKYINITPRFYKDDINSYYKIIENNSNTNTKLKELKFVNLSPELQNERLLTKFGFDLNNIETYLSKDIDFDNNEINYLTPDDINVLLNAIKPNSSLSNSNISKQINKNDYPINLRDCMIGLNVTCSKDSFFLKRNESIDININFLMGIVYAAYAYNHNDSIEIVANLKITLSDTYSNRKIYTIPIKYKII